MDFELHSTERVQHYATQPTLEDAIRVAQDHRHSHGETTISDDHGLVAIVHIDGEVEYTDPPRGL